MSNVLPRYKCHKEVRAFKIVAITAPVPNGAVELIYHVAAQAVRHEVSADYVLKHKPEPGGYYVLYTDGYESFSPAKAFEEGYTPVEDVLPTPHVQLNTDQAPKPVKPTIGRIVLYNHPGSVDGRYPPGQSPAIVQSVYPDNTVDLWVFGPKGLHKDGPYQHGDGPCQWTWPPRA